MHIAGKLGDQMGGPGPGLGTRLREQTLSGAICSAATGFRCPLASHAHFTEEQELQKKSEESRACAASDNAPDDERLNILARDASEAVLLCEEARRCRCTSAGGDMSLRDLYHHLRHKARFRAIDSGVPARGVESNPIHCIIFGALAERVAAAPDGSQLVEDLWNDFPHLMTSADDDAATMCGCFH